MRLKKPLTPYGHNILASEHEELAKVVRPKVLAGIQVAAAEGDRSENAEYIYGRKKLRELDKRLRYLNKLLDSAQIIKQIGNNNFVYFGCQVLIEDEDGKQKKWRIVGEGEAHLHEGGISWKSPVGKALLGKKVGNIIEVEIPRGVIELEILFIE